MTETGKNENKGLVSKRGFIKYEKNPSATESTAIKKQVKFGGDQKGFVVNGVGEVLGDGVAVFYEIKTVDNERFVKLFEEGMRKHEGLTKAGATMFSFICLKMRDNPNSDKVELSYEQATRAGLDMSDRVYRNGIRELLEREFIFESLNPGIFFINIRCMYNGDRQATITAYRRETARSIKT